MPYSREPRRVVVTGMGALTPIGLTVDEYWKSLLAGASGAGPITYFDTAPFDTKFACELKGFDAMKYLDRKMVQRSDRFTHYAIIASDMAIQDAALPETADKTRIGVIVGSGIGGMITFENQLGVLFSEGPKRMSPFFVPMMIADIAAGRISMKHGFKGPNYAVISACATSSHCIGTAFMHIQRGDADVMVTGGAEAAITRAGIGGFNASRALSTRNDAPQKASRPFDNDRDGFVMGEGGGTVILEELQHALRRGARIYCELAGFGFTADAHHITEPAPGGEGAVRSMRAAIADAGLAPDDIQYVNTHGTSTPLGDKAETAAIKTVFGERAKELAVNSTKSIIGHLLGAAGAVESIATIMSIMDQKVHPTINQEIPDPDCDLNYIPNKAQDWKINAALSNTFGFGGHNASLLFKKFQA